MRRIPIFALLLCLSLAQTSRAEGPSEKPGDASSRLEGSSPALRSHHAMLSTLGERHSVLPENLRYLPDQGSLALPGEKTVALEEVVFIEFPGEAIDSGPALLLLIGGEEVYATLADGDESELRFRSSTLGGESRALALESLQALVFPAQFRRPARFFTFKASLSHDQHGPIPVESPARDADNDNAATQSGKTEETARPEKDEATATDPVGETADDDGANDGSTDDGRTDDGRADDDRADDDRADDDKDAIYTLEGSRISGILNAVSSSHVDFEADGLGRLNLSFDKVRAIRLARLDVETEAPENAGTAPGSTKKVPGVELTLADGSLLRGALTQLGDGRITVNSKSLGEVQVPLSVLRSIEVQGGKGVHLSDLDPIGTRHHMDLFKPRPVQRDANVLGGPLKIRGQVYRKGLGMLSHVRLDYKLDRDYVLFQAVLGMDDEAVPTTNEAESRGGGVALFKIYLNDKEVYQKELSHRDAPETVELEVSDAGTLGIEVDYGPGFLILDYANWANARLIRK